MNADFFTWDEKNGLLTDTTTGTSCFLRHFSIEPQDNNTWFSFGCIYTYFGCEFDANSIHFVIAFEKFIAEWRRCFGDDIPSVLRGLPHCYCLVHHFEEKFSQNIVSGVNQMTDFLEKSADGSDFPIVAYSDLLARITYKMYPVYQYAKKKEANIHKKSAEEKHLIEKMTPFFEQVRSLCPSDYKGGKDGPINEAFLQYVKSEKAHQVEVKNIMSYSKFRRLYQHWHIKYDIQRNNDYIEAEGIEFPPIEGMDENTNVTYLIADIPNDFTFLDAVKKKNK